MLESTFENIEITESAIPDRYIDEDDSFPESGIDLLKSMGLMVLNVPKEFGGYGLGHKHGNREILEALKEIGSHDLSLGRIYEGHLNALLLIDRFGSPSQKHIYFRQVLSGKLFGIWNSELPSESLKFVSEGDGYVLEGAKVFCSGASNVHRPIVTAEGPGGSRMIVLDLDEYGLEEDFTHWRPMGMKSSVSCRFDLTGINFENKQLLGHAYDYVSEPDFTAGAVRFAAVQLGGAEAAIRAALHHLKKMDRTGSTEQIARMARLAILRETGRLWLKKVGAMMDGRYENPTKTMYHANMFRTTVREICEEILNLCEMSVGLQGMMEPHPLERIHRDLSVYLKQPGPDRTLTAVGKAFIQTCSKK